VLFLVFYDILKVKNKENFMKILAIVSAVFLVVFFPLLFILSDKNIPFYIWFALIGSILALISFIYILVYFLILLPRNKRKKQEEAEIALNQDKKSKLLAKVKEIKEMPLKELLEQNEMGQYCENFETNKVYTVETALKLNDNDLINIGISILGDRIKILSLIEKKQNMLNRADVLMKNIGRGEEIRINKNLFIWVGTFLFGGFGVDRFMRGQILVGIVKLLVVIFGVGFSLSGGLLGLLGCIWVLVDWIYALLKYNKYDEEFVFIDGNYEK
jgi:cbb3-type cytochrome oxidase subunit 3/TM2 domain-containing membrane protein YozV